MYTAKSSPALLFKSTQPKDTFKLEQMLQSSWIWKVTWAKESEVWASLVAHGCVGSLPASNEFENRLGISERIVLMSEWIVEHLLRTMIQEGIK